MPRISFTFQGYVSGADIDEVTGPDGSLVKVKNLPVNKLTKMLNDGKLFISLGDFLYDRHKDVEIELMDFEEY